MKRLIQALLTASMITVVPATAQKEAPEIRFDSVPEALKLPAGLYLGEVGGVATNSRGDVFVYTRTGHPTITIGTARPFAHDGSRLFEFDRNGKFVREIGKDSYGFMFAAQVRVDPSDARQEGTAPGSRRTCSTGRLTSPGTPLATSSLLTAWAMRVSRSSTKKANSPSRGARREPRPESSPMSAA